jgi:DNA-binding XRE family transcriptional regulator
VKTYRAPRRPAPLVHAESNEAGPPRDFSEWKALRRWGKLPAAEREVAGYLLRLVREEAGLTQAALAGRLGVTQQAVAQAERWTSNPTLGLLRQWLGACGFEFRLEVKSGAGDDPVPNG